MSTPTVLGLDHVVLRVTDLDRARDFYRDVLGCRVEVFQKKIGLLRLRAAGHRRPQHGPLLPAGETVRPRRHHGAPARPRRQSRHRRAALRRRGHGSLDLSQRPRRQRGGAQGSRHLEGAAPGHMSARKSRGGRPLQDIETWIFDLDNTLYPHSCNLFAEVEARMAAFMCAEFGIDTEAAHAMRRRYFKTYGTTLRGLMNENGIDPHRFLDYVHQIDVTPVKPAPKLKAALEAL